MSATTGFSPDAISTRAEWAQALTAARAGAGLTVRELARRAGVPAGTLGDYLTGRHLPTASQLSTFGRVLDQLGLAQQSDQWIAALHRVRTATDRRVARAATPYRGLNAFEPEDASVFFGREDETAQLLALISAVRADPTVGGGLIAVVGASGSGKSSLLRAGLAAALRDAGSDAGDCVLMTPGADPRGGLASASGRLTPDGALVVDQFEEIFTSVPDPAERAAFLDALARLATEHPVVFGMRADFYVQASREPVLLDALRHAQMLVGPMGLPQLTAAIVGPARSVGAGVDDGLVDLVLADLSPRDAGQDAHDAGALPLLSHALLTTWENGGGNRLTVADYRAGGGIDGAVQRSAEEVYSTLDDAGTTTARRVFLRLVNIDDEVAVTRRRVSREELAALDPGSEAEPAASGEGSAADIVARFVDRRLLTASGTSVEISHEALLSAWPRLRGWIDDDRAGLRLHRQITDGANAWDAAARDEALLLRGTRLDVAEEWAADPVHAGELNATEQGFVRTALDARDAERLRVRHRTRRLRRLLVAVAVLAVVALALAGYSAVARSDADRAESQATASRDDALSRQVAIESQQLSTSNPALSQQLALVAYRISRTQEARGVAIDASARPMITRFLGRFGFLALADAPKRGVVATGQATTGAVHLISDVGIRPHLLSTMHLEGSKAGSVTAMAFSPDQKTLFAVGTPGRFVAWDVSDPRRPEQLASVDLGRFLPHAIAVTADGRQVLLGGTGSAPLQLWDVSALSAPRQVSAPGGTPASLDVQTLAYSADGRFLVAGGRDRTIYLWRLTGSRSPRRIVTDGNLVFSTLFAPSRLYVGHSGGGVDVFDPSTGKRVGTLAAQTNSWSLSLALSPDGATIGVGTSDNAFRQYSTRTLRQLSSTIKPAQITGLAYRSDGSGVVLACGDGTTLIEPFHGRTLPVAATAFNLAFDSSGKRLMVASDGAGGSVQVFDVTGTPREVTRPIAMSGTSTGAGGTGAISPDGNLVGAGNFKGQVQLFDIHDPAHPRAWAPPFQAGNALVESMSISPDGRLLAVAGDDRALSLWDITKPARPSLLSRSYGRDIFYSVAFSPDGRMVAGANVDSHAYLWTIADTRHPVLRDRLGGFEQEVWAVAFSRDSSLLAATGSDRTTRLWNVGGVGKPSPHGPVLTGPTDYVLGASFNNDGSLLAVASNDRTVRLYDLAGGSPSPIETLTSVAASVFGIAFSPDGRTLVAGGRADAVAVWTTDPDAYASRVCSLGGDSITRTEWALYVPGTPYDPPCR